jgi:hypothetical protein
VETFAHDATAVKRNHFEQQPLEENTGLNDGSRTGRG